MEQLEEKRRQIFNLGLVSLFNDLSSEVVIRVLPLYLIIVVQASVFGVGIIEAIAESTATLGKLLSGYYSDRQMKRKPLIFAGYALSVLSRPLILFQPTLVVVSLSRFLDKIGKSVRTPARDALIADLSDSENRGRNFGINRALDTLGAVIGLLGVYAFLRLARLNDALALKTILAWACGIGFATLIVLGLGVKEMPPKHLAQSKILKLSLMGLDLRIRFYLVIGLFFALASSSDAFIIVRFKEIGLSMGTIFLILAGFNIVSASTAFYLGHLSDKRGRKIFLTMGWLIYAFVYFFFSLSQSTPLLIAVFLFYGLFYSLTDGIEKALVADFAQGEQKGQTYGWLGLIQGLAVIPANLIFASLYEKMGSAWAFRSSAVFAMGGILLLVFFNPQSVKFNPQGLKREVL